MANPASTRAARPALLTALLSGLLCAGLLTACSAPQDDDASSVASLPPASDTGTASADDASADAGADDEKTDDEKADDKKSGDDALAARPQVRLDDSPEREAALWNTYDQCLLDNGAQANDGRQAGPAPATGGREKILVLQPVPEKAKEACADLEPLGPVELDPDLNPDYHDDMVAWVTCMQERGMPVHLSKDTADPSIAAWTYDDSNAKLPDDAMTIEEDCKYAAFGGDR